MTSFDDGTVTRIDTKTAKVVGDANHDVLTVEAGAFIEGFCKRRESAPAKSADASQASDSAQLLQKLGAGPGPATVNGARAAALI